jgi:prophage DNA circulation protein
VPCEAAQALGPKLAKAQPAAYKGVTFDVQRVERDGGVFFRVRAGYFADWAEASLFCNRLASLKQDCIVVAR